MGITNQFWDNIVLGQYQKLLIGLMLLSSMSVFAWDTTVTFDCYASNGLMGKTETAGGGITRAHEVCRPIDAYCGEYNDGENCQTDDGKFGVCRVTSILFEKVGRCVPRQTLPLPRHW